MRIGSLRPVALLAAGMITNLKMLVKLTYDFLYLLLVSQGRDPLHQRPSSV